MLDQISGKPIHTYVHIFTLSSVAIGLSTSKVIISLGMMLVLLNLLIKADFKSYYSNIRRNQLFLLVALLFLLHIVGLLWSDNMDYALHDLRAKLPLIVLPLTLVCFPLSERKHRDFILCAFLLSIFITSLFNYALYQHWIGNSTYDDIRGMSRLVSHVRYGLLISMGIAISLYLIKNAGLLWRIVLTIIILWFTYYNFYSQVISGFLTMLGVYFVFLLYTLRVKHRYTITLMVATAVTGFMGVVLWLYVPLHVDPMDYQHLPTHTKQGNPYEHNLMYVSSETREPILIYLCEPELRAEWMLRSDIPYDSTDIKGNPIGHTLIRYLSSKKLTRDAEGVQQLSDKDIQNIENGYPSVNHSGIWVRMHALRFELNNPTDPNGHSLLQRFLYWQAGIEIAFEHWMIGVGTGDVQDTFNDYYERTDSKLIQEHRRRSHNQFITFFLTFGIAGLILFIFLICKFLQHNFREHTVPGILFMTIAILSFFMEDTLETQTGVTFFGLFFGLFQYARNERSTNSTGSFYTK